MPLPLAQRPADSLGRTQSIANMQKPPRSPITVSFVPGEHTPHQIIDELQRQNDQLRQRLLRIERDLANSTKRETELCRRIARLQDQADA